MWLNDSLMISSFTVRPVSGGADSRIGADGVLPGMRGVGSIRASAPKDESRARSAARARNSRMEHAPGPM
jgi:hypothetical protein